MTDRHESDARATAREFLRLPSSALPGAMCYLRADAEMYDAWAELRAFAAGGPLPEVPIRIRADRAGWRDGYIIRGTI